MPLIERAGVETPLPQMAAATMKAIDILRVAKMRSADGFCKRILGVRDRDDMDVIAHQTIADKFKGVLVRLLFQKLQVYPAVIVHEEYGVAIIAALRYMMRKSYRYCSG